MPHPACHDDPLTLQMCLRETYEEEEEVLKLLASQPEVVALQQTSALNFLASEDNSVPVSVCVRMEYLAA